ncbi:hypothetical protein MKW94_012123 [Papaver nudicaule]|uniref:Chromo domain-containing protein n=1 Tax=Papaver nudicaule TaxID=74823 RepID=A0AA41RZE6_PAPNU|nr:hypothetical protein [Papaver nudicaule]
MRGRGRGGWRRFTGVSVDDEEEEEHKSSTGDEEDSDESEIRLELEQQQDEDENEEEEEEEGVEYAEEENHENHTQQQQHQEQEGPVDGEDAEEEEDEEEEGENDEQPDPPKLDEGFYEIEDVRRKKVRKGQTLYYIKWRGWPESSNTWEPIENLQACVDVVEAFEESLKSGSRGRKRKRKGSLSQPKKTQQRTPSSSTVSGSKPGRKPKSLTSPAVDSSRPSIRPRRHRVASKSVYGESKGNEKNEGGFKNEDANNMEKTAQQTENGNGSSKAYELREKTPTDNLNSETGKVSIHFADMRTSDMVEGHSVELPKVDVDENTQSNRFTGAKRRKSGNVKRFKKEDAQNGVGDGEGRTGDDQQKVERLSNPCSITKIIKPIGYSASISNDVQDVCVTFVAISSDGREVVVDNKQLKADNPQLLISFYEQHLRCSPPA